MTSKKLNDTKDIGNMNVKSWKKQNTAADVEGVRTPPWIVFPKLSYSFIQPEHHPIYTK